MKKELIEKIVSDCESNALVITESINKSFLELCNNSQLPATEESYRAYFTEFIEELFGLKSLSMSREFTITLTPKE